MAGLFAAVVYGVIIFSGPRVTGENSAPVARQLAPEWPLKDLAGKTIQSTDLKGKVLILDFWAARCGPRHEEIPGFIALQKQYGDQGLTVIGASVDELGVGTVKKFASELGMNYYVGVADHKLQRAFRVVDALPMTLVMIVRVVS
jgi:peroxiredoxin